MSRKIPYTRRQFLRSSLAMISGVTTAPAFLTHSAWAMTDTSMRTRSKPGVPEDRILLVIQLSGGNDGLNTVVPYGSAQYYNQRPRIAVPEREVITVDPAFGLGLHPSLWPIYEMMEQGLATILQGVGYPNPNRSHFASMDVWHAGDTRGARGDGWIGRALDELQKAEQSTGMDCVSISSEAPLATQGRLTRSVTLENPSLFRYRHADRQEELAQAYDALQQAKLAEAEDDPTAFVFRTAMDAQVASQRVGRSAEYETETRFPGGPLSDQLAMVARMIRAELPTRVYYVAQGGYDTHADQYNRHANLLAQFARSVRAFYDELKALGQQSRVLTVAFSEFGRRVRQNGSAGTDHGAAAPMFLFGEALRPGLLGDHPPLNDLYRGDLTYDIDFRSVYRDVLENWMRIDADRVFPRDIGPLGVIAT